MTTKLFPVLFFALALTCSAFAAPDQTLGKVLQRQCETQAVEGKLPVVEIQVPGKLYVMYVQLDCETASLETVASVMNFAAGKVETRVASQKPSLSFDAATNTLNVKTALAGNEFFNYVFQIQFQLETRGAGLDVTNDGYVNYSPKSKIILVDGGPDAKLEQELNSSSILRQGINLPALPYLSKSRQEVNYAEVLKELSKLSL